VSPLPRISIFHEILRLSVRFPLAFVRRRSACADPVPGSTWKRQMRFIWVRSTRYCARDPAEMTSIPLFSPGRPARL